MKVTSKSNEEFQPITLELVIESEQEARALYAIFNHIDNADLLRSAGTLAPAGIRQAIGKKFEVEYGYITDKYSYEDWYK